MDAFFEGTPAGQAPVTGQAPPPAPEPPSDTRRVATPREAYLLSYGTDEEKARLRAEVREVRPPLGPAKPRAPRPAGSAVPAAVKAAGAGALGIVLLILGTIDHVIAAEKAAICNSGLGQLGQAFDQSAAQGCTLYTGMESLTGWLVAGGVLALLSAAALLMTGSRKPASPAGGTRRPPGGQSY
jgi:hypothetical protein